MSDNQRNCPDCSPAREGWNRRDFLKTAGGAVVAAGTLPHWAVAADTPPAASSPETLVKVLYDKLDDKQKSAICYSWDHQDPKRGLLRTFVANNWNINDIELNSDFYTPEQKAIVREIFVGMVQPEWVAKFDKQLEDDAGGFGEDQSIAIFGKPGDGKFELVVTGRHMTMRCDGNSADHVAFGGPIFYGHAAGGNFDEAPDHPGNVFWHQALAANKLYEMLDGKQRKLALVEKLPREQDAGFRGSAGGFPGIPISELSADQAEHAQKVLQTLIEPYRQSDRDEALACIKAQGGLEKCSLAFYQQGDIGGDGVWDCWRLEGPAMVWYFRGAPHVHVWVNIADDPSVKLNA